MCATHSSVTVTCHPSDLASWLTGRASKPPPKMISSMDGCMSSRKISTSVFSMVYFFASDFLDWKMLTSSSRICCVRDWLLNA